VGECCFQIGTIQYFGVSPSTIRVDVRVGRELASCYGVNLAFAALALLAFFANCKGRALVTADLFRDSGQKVHSKAESHFRVSG